MNRYWFKPKRFGLGAEPITWEGWALIGVFILVMLYFGFNIDKTNMASFYLKMFMAVSILIIISKNKTDGPWKRNWG